MGSIVTFFLGNNQAVSTLFLGNNVIVPTFFLGNSVVALVDNLERMDNRRLCCL